MGFIVKADKIKSKFANIEPGIHLIKWIGVVGLGTQKNTFPNAKTPVIEKVWLQFITQEGNYLSKVATLSLYEKSFFMQLLSAVLHKTPQEIQKAEEDIQVADILKNGAFLYGNVEVTDQGKPRLIGVMPAKDGEMFENSAPIVAVSIDEAVEDISKVPYDWLKNIVKQSEEWVNAHPVPVDELEKQSLSYSEEESKEVEPDEINFGESDELKETEDKENNEGEELEENDGGEELEENSEDNLKDPLLESDNTAEDALKDDDLEEKEKTTRKSWLDRIKGK